MPKKGLLSGLCFFIFFTAQSQVAFRLNSLPLKYTPELDTLFLAGNFNNWNPRDTAYRFKRNLQNQLEIRVNSVLSSLEYKITRGSWSVEEVSATGQAIQNRVSTNVPNSTINIDVADWKDTKGTHTSTAQVQVLTSQLWLSALKKYRRIWVCLPAEYSSQPTKRYPVMYFHDGQNVFDAATSFAGEWKVDEAQAQLEAVAGYEPIITVGIDNGGADRLSELTPFRHPTYGGGNGEKYAEALATDVKNLIDSRFRTKTDAENTAIGGSSLGGVETLFMAYRYPSIYSKALIFSPSLWFSDSLRQFCLVQNQPANSRLYWVCGTNEGDPDMVPDLNACYADLITAGMPSTQMKKTVVTGGTHSEGFWSSQVKSGISWLFSTTTPVKKKENQKRIIQLQQKEKGIEIENLNPGQTIDIQVFNVNGRLIYSHSFNQQMFNLTLSGKGIYILKAKSDQRVEIVKLHNHGL